MTRFASLTPLLLLIACGASPSSDATPTNEANADASNRGGADDPAEAGDEADGQSEPVQPPFELPADGSLPKLRKVQTEHLGQLTGTNNNPSQRVGIDGTDLGATFERDGKLVYIFGDSWTPGGRRQDQDSIAWSTETSVPAFGSIPKLTWVTDGAGQFTAPRLPNVNLGGMNVPMEGIAVGPKTYVFFTTGFNGGTGRYSHSVLAEMNGLDVASMRVVHNVPTGKFINVSAVVEGTTAYIYGSGDYRASPVYLAKVDIDKLGDRNQWRYFANGKFEAGENAAQPIAPTPCVGELSVRKWEKVGLYFMAYNCGTPRGINLRWARTPEGPWSEPINIFDPGRDADRGYEHFMHAKESVVGHDDGLSEPNREEDWGGEYGPYFIPRYFTEEPNGVLSLVYVLSSWNPYQAHLMKTRIVLESNPFKVKPKGVDMPPPRLVNGDFSQGLTGWEKSGGEFGVFNGEDGKPRVTSFVGSDTNVGRIWQDFTVDATTKELRFKVHGGEGRVMLMHGNEVVRSTRGRKRNTPELQTVWTINDFAGEKVRLVIDDSVSGAWGFIGVSGFELK